MFDFLFKSPALQLVAQSDWMSKLVLLILFALSIICVAVMIFKFKILKQQKKDLNNVLTEFKKINSLEELLNLTQKYQNSIVGKFLQYNLTDLKKILEKNSEARITAQNLEYLELIADQHIDQFVLDLEQYLPILSTSAAVSPLLGLFGTVWGLIHSFINISQEKSADIAIVAPGIAEALITTLAGLIVAIPAMVAFNYFANECKKSEQQLYHLTDRYLSIVKQTYFK